MASGSGEFYAAYVATHGPDHDTWPPPAGSTYPPPSDSLPQIPIEEPNSEE